MQNQRFSSTADAIRQSQALERLQSLKDGTLVPIPTEFIRLSRNIRTEDIDKRSDDFKQLLASIREVGLLHSPVVTIIGEELVCVAGHRRIAAMMELGHDKVPCLLRHFSQLEHKEVAQFVENMARKNLHPLDVARQLQLLREQGYSQGKLQELLGRDRKTIGRFQKMAAWPDEAKALIFAHAHKLKTGFLLQLASRDMPAAALLSAIRQKAGLEKKTPGAKPAAFQKAGAVARSGSADEWRDRTRTYFSSKGYTPVQRSLILRALVDLGVVEAGILDPIASDGEAPGILDPIAALAATVPNARQSAAADAKAVKTEAAVAEAATTAVDAGSADDETRATEVKAAAAPAKAPAAPVAHGKSAAPAPAKATGKAPAAAPARGKAVSEPVRKGASAKATPPAKSRPAAKPAASKDRRSARR